MIQKEKSQLAPAIVTDVVHYFMIKVYDKRGGELIEYLSWTGLVWQLRLKYDWYFRYRAALLQVKYPKYVVDCHWGNVPAEGKSKEYLEKVKIRAKKAKITEYKNKLAKAKAQWASLFPIEDDPDFQRAVEKIKRLEFELLGLNTGVNHG